MRLIGRKRPCRIKRTSRSERSHTSVIRMDERCGACREGVCAVDPRRNARYRGVISFGNVYSRSWPDLKKKGTASQAAPFILLISPDQIYLEMLHISNCHSAEKCDSRQNSRHIAARCTRMQCQSMEPFSKARCFTGYRFFQRGRRSALP